MSFEGERVLITGAAHRLGRAAAEAFAAEGADILIHYHSAREEAEEALDACRGLGVEASSYKADLTGPRKAEELLLRLEEEELLPSILVNSASFYRNNTFETMSHAELQNDIALTAYAPLELSRGLAARRDSGCILNILDARIVDYDAKHLSYHLAKELLFDLTRILALELAPAFRVNGLAPGIILPPENSSEELIEKYRRGNPLERVGSIEEFSESLLFLARSRFITGDVLFLDGGRHLHGRMYGL